MLVDRHVLVVLLQRLAVFGERDGFRIENSNRDMLAAKFNRTVSRGNPSLERGFSIIAHCYPHVSSFERANGHAILLARFRWWRIGSGAGLRQFFFTHRLRLTHF